jgi:(1->4)-alpha-D-glucan 1-alpha-D-glucosylmutase
VDPDNRRPVDFGKRRICLKEIMDRADKNMLGLIHELLSKKEDGRIKLFLIHRALRARKDRSRIFQNGAYIPMQAGGKYSRHVIAFARKYEGRWAISLAPRFLTSLITEDMFPLDKQVWDDTYVVLPEPMCSQWRDAVSDRTVSGEKTLMIAEAMKCFPVALLFNLEEAG